MVINMITDHHNNEGRRDHRQAVGPGQRRPLPELAKAEDQSRQRVRDAGQDQGPGW